LFHNIKNMKKINLKNSEVATRNDAYSVAPLSINVDHSKNPRQDYGDQDGSEDFGELKESIKIHGLLQPVSIYIDQTTGLLHLAHGFRRMKAVLELVAEGVNIEKIKVFEVPNNEETILLQHFVLNTGKPFKDLELADMLNQLTVMGEENKAEISRQTGIKYEKVVRLIDFARKSSTKIKKAVQAKELSLTTAISLVNALDSISDQNTALETAKEDATAKGSKKIKVENIQVLKKADESVNLNAKLRTFISTVKSTDNADLDQDFATRLENLLNAMEAKTLGDKEIMGTYFTKVTAEA
jgi:ParB-like chromosome segregation protein Spo0J